MAYKILVTDGLAEDGLALLRREAEVVQSADLNGLGSIDALLVRGRTAVTRPVLQAASPRLKVVGRAGAGVDNIDLAAAREHGVVVVNAPGAGSAAVAELTLALMLALARQLPQASASLRAGEWHKSDLSGIELGGKTLGLIGVGRIGSLVAGLAAAFGMQVLGYDPMVPPEVLQRRGAQPAALQALLAQADVISLHVPLSSATRHMIDAERLAQVKPGALLINTARGEVVDEAALLQALQSGRIGGAALDVFSREPPGLDPLLQHPAVVATPHLGAQTAEAQQRTATEIATEVLAALRGEPLRWRVR